MKFQHEINQGKNFLHELESFLKRDFLKENSHLRAMNHALENGFKQLSYNHEQEIKKLKLKISQQALEIGRLIKENQDV